MRKLPIAVLLLLLLYLASPAQVFKAPKDVFPLDAEKTGFHGMIMLRKDKPSGLFIVYPKENETMDQVRERLAKYVVPMFLHGTDPLPQPQTSSIPGHKGDASDSGISASYMVERSQVRVLYYERRIQDKTYTYGYFAYVKEGTKDLPDAKGNGIKFFDEFWKTLEP